MSKDRLSLLAAVAVMAAWGVNFSFVKHVLAEIGVGAFLFVRFTALPLLGLALMLAVFRGTVFRTWPRREDLPRFIACALVGHALHLWAVMVGMDLSTAFSSSLVLTTAPLFTLLILAAGAERLRREQLAGTLAACAGIALFLGDKLAAGAARAGLGDLLLIGAAALFSLYTVLAQPLAQRYGPLPVLAYTLLFAAPFILVATLPAFLATPAAAYTPAVWTGLLWALIVSSFFGWMLWTWVNIVRGIARSAPFAYLMPPIAGLVAWWTLGETFSGLKLAGAAITLAGVAYAQFGRRPAAREP